MRRPAHQKDGIHHHSDVFIAGMVSSSLNNRPVISTLAVIAFLAIWEIAPRSGIADATYTSQPSRVVAAGWEIVRTGGFLHDVSVSLAEFAMGFVLAVAVGVSLGLVLGKFPVLRYLLDPPIMAIYATPHLALLPIIVVWLGIGMQSKVAVAFVGGVIPILVNSMAGVRGVERSWVVAARSFCARERDVFFKVILPASLPSVILGVRLGVSRAVLGVVCRGNVPVAGGSGERDYALRFGIPNRSTALRRLDRFAVRICGDVRRAGVRTKIVDGREMSRVSAWKSSPVLLGIVSFAAILLIWEAVVRLNWANPFFISQPSAIAASLDRAARSGELWRNFSVSLGEFAIGYGASVVIGILTGALAGRFRTVEYALEPFSVVSVFCPADCVLSDLRAVVRSWRPHRHRDGVSAFGHSNHGQHLERNSERQSGIASRCTILRSDRARSVVESRVACFAADSGCGPAPRNRPGIDGSRRR